MQTRQQPVEFALDDAVAFACTRLETFTIQDLDAATTVMDQAGVMELACGFCHAFTTHAQHVRNQLLRDLQLVRRGAIYFDEKPAAQLLVERVVAINWLLVFGWCQNLSGSRARRGFLMGGSGSAKVPIYGRGE